MTKNELKKLEWRFHNELGYMVDCSSKYWINDQNFYYPNVLFMSYRAILEEAFDETS